ncbi:hypothetical protein RDWZM_009637 [Blomia tropicalis]|uniref:HOOK N-terminal domain-containing protein n=1 Tax=Blomia tropicalis TaxID=40697 RepID=A0A9Q0M6Y7_BLOTA|nr:hypothetical protein RDWZM_009637 [Blomia tropicalis]
MNSNQMRETFMQSPLVTWVRTLFDDNCSDYSQLCNGLFLHKAWNQIDPHPPLPSLNINGTQCENTSLSRIRNLNLLLNNIRTFYENVLDQVLVIRLPDVANIAFNCDDDNDEHGSSIPPESPLYGLISTYCSNGNCDDLRIFLLLILGCAVQCEQKEMFIEKIKQLDIGTQHAIVECIQQITDNPESVFLVTEWTEPPSDEVDKDRLYISFVSLILRLTKERDQLYQRVVDLTCELLNHTITNNGTTNQLSDSNCTSLKNLSLSNSSLNNIVNHCDQKSHYLVELADVKGKLRRVQQELEEKNEVVVELKEVIEQNKEFCNKLRHDNLELTQEARSAKAYRDEIDILNERVRKIDRLEAETQRYRDKVIELDFFKSRVEELREDNRILGETKAMLEEQLESSRKRADKLPELEEKILKLNAFGNELNLQRELDKNQMERLIEEIAHLRQEKKSANDELSRVQLELTDLRAQIRLNNETSLTKSSEAEEGNLFDQINQDTAKRMIKLEHENQKLQNLLEDYRNNYVDIDSLLSLTDFYQKDNVSESGSTDSGFNSNKTKAQRLNELKEYIEKLKTVQNNVKSLENVKVELEKEVTELKGQLHDQCNKCELMERNYTSSCAENQKFQRIIESKNKKIEEYMSELSSIENENQKLLTNADSLKLSLRKLNDLEIEMTNLEGDKHRLEQEKKSLDKEISRLKTSIQFKDGVIDENAGKLSSFELENKKLKKDIESINQMTGKVKELEKENKDLTNATIVQRNTLTKLQEDLVNEKLRAQKYSDEFAKTLDTVRNLCMEHGLTMEPFEPLSDGNLSNAMNLCFQMTIDKCLQPKEAQIIQLQVQLEELTTANNRMQNMIDSLRRQLNVEDDASDKFSLNSLNELQRKIVCLEDESKCLRNELNVQKEMYSEMGIKSELNESKLMVANERNSELQNVNAKLQVENSLLKSQNSSLEAQTNDLHEQMAFIQDSIEKFKLKCEEYEATHRLLIVDNESLQEIHQQLTSDYDTLTNNHGTLKQSYKTLKAENKSLEEQLRAIILKHEQLVDKTNKELQCLQMKATKENVDETNYKEKLSQLSEEHKNLNEEHKRLQNEHKMLQNIYKKLRSDNNELKLKHTELQGETAECRDQMNALNVEVSKLSNYCEMVALTNNTLEVQRKKLTTQSGSLLSQYNDLLLELSNGCEKSVVDKLRELCLKKERLEKMFKEYDISIEKNMPRVSHKDSNHTDAIYGRLWEAETPPLHYVDSHHGISSTALLRQYTLCNEKDKKLFEINGTPPPRIPPRAHIPRSPLSISHLNSHETVIELTQVPNQENKMSINVSTRSPNISISRTQDNIDGNISKVQISSTGNSPHKSNSVINNSSSPSSNVNGGHFMRGSFKSNSVNYGNLMRRPLEPNSKLNGVRHGNHSPQLFHISTNRSSMTSNPIIGPSNISAVHHRTIQYNAASPTYHSDSSTSHDSEKEIEHNNNNNIISNGNTTTTPSRSRTLITNGVQSIEQLSTSTSTNGPKDNVQLSNVLNNNGDNVANTRTTPNCTNGLTNDANSNNSNSIWYEYGCV